MPLSRLPARISRARQMRWQDWRDLVRAMRELWHANRALRRMAAPELDLGRPVQPAEIRQSDAKMADLLSRVSIAVPRAARLVPWRSSCLVQAQAARSWLAREGVGSEIRFGLDEARTGPFEAHAWLVADGKVITGGEISHFTPFS